MCTDASKQKDLLLSHFNISPIAADLLILKGIDTPYKAFTFLHSDLAFCYSPFLMNGMSEAVECLKNAIANKKKIGIFADSDIDGLTSLTLLTHLLNLLSVQYWCRYPVDDELYGLTVPIIDEFTAHNVECIITLDSGIRDIEEIHYARNRGMDVIVCDHHEPLDILPDARIINPKLPHCTYPYKELAGVGVVFKLCIAVLLSYTRYFEKHIIIVASHNEKIHYSVIHKGIVVAQNSGDAIEEFVLLLNDYHNSILFHLDVPEVNVIKNMTLYNIKDYLPVLSPLINFSWTDLKNIFPSALDYAAMLVHKIQNQQSKKLLQFIKDMLPLVAVGTNADMMPLIDENRILVNTGISYFYESNHCGIKVLREHISKKINSDVISWDISPLLNTPGRFGKTKLAADFFLENNTQKVKDKLNEIIQMNKKRKNIIQQIVGKFTDSYINTNDLMVVIQSDEIPAGLTGPIANRLADQWNKPAIVIADNPHTAVVKGSGRSHNSIDLFSFISESANIFEKIGGHNHAFGFSIKRDNIPLLRSFIETAKRHISTETNVSQHYDYELAVEQINFDFLEVLNLFEPYGVGQKPFVFLSKKCTINKYFFINGKHVKMIFEGSINVESIAFNAAAKYKDLLAKNQPVDIIYTVKSNEYNGCISPLILLNEMRLSDPI